MNYSLEKAQRFLRCLSFEAGGTPEFDALLCQLADAIDKVDFASPELVAHRAKLLRENSVATDTARPYVGAQLAGGSVLRAGKLAGYSSAHFVVWDIERGRCEVVFKAAPQEWQDLFPEEPIVALQQAVQAMEDTTETILKSTADFVEQVEMLEAENAGLSAELTLALEENEGESDHAE